MMIQRPAISVTACWLLYSYSQWGLERVAMEKFPGGRALSGVCGHLPCMEEMIGMHK